MAQDTLNADETAIAELTDGTTLIKHDDGGGSVRFEIDIDDPDEPDYYEQSYESLKDAQLAFGLWLRCGPFIAPESGRSIPVEVATDGQAAIASYLLVGRGTTSPRRYVAEKMGVTEQTVSNYANRVRWSPTETTEQEDT